jgi:hypothetical protein
MARPEELAQLPFHLFADRSGREERRVEHASNSLGIA